jgi:SAM-dependent methyltransferase
MNVRSILKKLRNIFSVKISFDNLKNKEAIFLYAGDVPQNGLYNKFIGLSLSRANSQHIEHNVTNNLPLNDSCVDIYQSEDVFEHIELEKLPSVIGEIYRVLKPHGIFRLSLPDYQCDILNNRTQKNEAGELLFDPDGGGDFINGKVTNGGHIWFPLYKTVKELLEKTQFKDIRFYHYYDESGKGVTMPIDYSIGHIQRTPDHDERVKNPYRPMSLVVDCIK